MERVFQIYIKLYGENLLAEKSLLCLQRVQHEDNTGVKLFDSFTCFILSFRQQLSEVYGEKNHSILIMYCFDLHIEISWSCFGRLDSSENFTCGIPRPRRWCVSASLSGKPWLVYLNGPRCCIIAQGKTQHEINSVLVFGKRKMLIWGVGF